MAKYLVTGAAGFIGSHIAHALLDQGHFVIGLDNLSNGHRHNLPIHNDFHFIEGDIQRSADTDLACEDVDYVLHLAALGSVPRSMKEPERYFKNNVLGTQTVLDSAKKAGVKRLVFSSSSSVYGNTPVLPKVESMTPTPMSPYAEGKLEGEQRCLRAHSDGLSTISLRYFNVFGPRQDPHSQYAAVIPQFITAALENRPMSIHGTGEQTRDFTYIANVVATNIAAATAEETAAGTVYNVGAGGRISIKELADKIKEEIGSDAPHQYSERREGDVQDSQADIAKLQNAIALPRPISLEQGLSDTIAWYKQQ